MGAWSTWYTLFLVGAVPFAILYLVIRRVVRSRGLEFPIWNWMLPRGLKNFHHIIGQEAVGRTRTCYRLLAAAFYLAMVWCVFCVWMSVMAGAAS